MTPMLSSTEDELWRYVMNQVRDQVGGRAENLPDEQVERPVRNQVDDTCLGKLMRQLHSDLGEDHNEAVDR